MENLWNFNLIGDCNKRIVWFTVTIGISGQQRGVPGLFRWRRHNSLWQLSPVFPSEVCWYWLNSWRGLAVSEMCKYIQWVPQLFERLEFFHVNKSCKIEFWGHKTHQITQNMILSRNLELKLSLFWRTTISGQNPLYYSREKVCETLPKI